MTAPELGTTARTDRLVDLTARLVAAYVSKNAVPPAVLPTMIENVHAALIRLTKGLEGTGIVAPKPEPAVDPKKSVTDDYIICLEDGQRFKSLKRHLMKAFGLTPGTVSRKVAARAVIPDGRAELCGNPFTACKEYGTRPQAESSRLIRHGKFCLSGVCMFKLHRDHDGSAAR
jgi:predicted transcriptional regulator